jgi:VCBS repeat-containing protein
MNIIPSLVNVATSGSYTGNTSGTPLSPGLTIVDADSPTLLSATIRIGSGFLPGDILFAATVGTAITAAYDAITGTLTLSGIDTLGHYEQVLRSVTFSSTSPDPTGGGAEPARTIDWQLNDGSGIGFQPVHHYAAGDTARSVAVGDVNGDGFLDAAVANAGVSTVSILLGNGGGTFTPSADVTVGTTPRSVILADVNGDHALDVVTADAGSNTVSVRLGNGNGSFQAQATFAAGASPIDIESDDFNGDGKRDLVLANFGGTDVSVLLGNGDGTFGAATSYAAGARPRGVAIADLNGDGKRDLVVANQDSNDVSVLLGNGDGTFGAATSYGALDGSLDVSVGDVNGDGRLDLVVPAFFANHFAVLLGNGDGTFQTQTHFGTGTQFGLFSSALGDLDHDGILDLAVTNFSSHTVSVWRGKGDGTFEPASNFFAGGSPTIVEMADLDGDGSLDLAIASQDNGLAVLLNDNNVSLSVVQHTTLSIDAANDAPVMSNVAASALYVESTAPIALAGALTLADADNPTLASARVFISHGFVAGDVLHAETFATGVTASYDATIGALTLSGAGTLADYQSVLRSVTFSSGSDNPTGSGAFPTRTIAWQVNDGTAISENLFQAQTQFATDDGPNAVTLGDFNGDGKLDFATANSGTDDVSVRLGNGAGGFGAATNFPMGAGVGARFGLTTGDFNGDGSLDLVVGDISYVSVLLGDGAGGFSAATSFLVGSTVTQVVAADLNGDGKLDIAASNSDLGKISVLLGDGAGGFSTPASFTTTGAAGNTNSLAVGDINGDGKLDLVAGNFSDGNIAILLGNGDGSYQPVTFSTHAHELGNPGNIALADLNGDGKLDVVSSDVNYPNINVQLGNGDGTFAAATYFDAGTGQNSVAVADLNGDGKLDIAATSFFAGVNKVFVLLGNGDGTFQTHQDFATGSDPRRLTIGDVDGTNGLDLLIPNFGSDNVSVLLSNSTNLSTIQYTTVNVTAVNDAPVANPDTNAGDPVTEAGAAGLGDPLASGNLLANDTNAGDTGILTAVSANSGTTTALGSDATHSGFGPTVAALDNGGSVLIWERYDSGFWNVFCQRYDGAGQAVGAEFQVNSHTPTNTVSPAQLYPSVTALDGGGFVVTWASNHTDGSSEWHIYGQRYDAGGAPAGGEFNVSTYTTFGQNYSAVTALSSGAFVVTWSSYVQDTNGWGVFGQRFDAAGNAAGGEFQINSFTPFGQLHPAAAGLADGGYVVTWTSADQDGSLGGIYAQRFHAEGTVFGSEFRVNTTTALSQEGASVAALLDGGFVVTWKSAGQDGGGFGIYAQRYHADGTSSGVEFRVNTHTASDQTAPSVAALPDGGFIVTWNSEQQDGSGSGVYGQAYDAQSQIVGSDFRLNLATSGNQAQDPVVFGNPIAVDAAGRLLAAWTHGDAGTVVYGHFNTATAGVVGGTTQGAYGTLTLNSDGSYTYTLDNNDPDTQALTQGQAVSDIFTYEVSDASGATSTATLTIAVTGANDSPVLADVAANASYTEDAAATVLSSGLTVTDVDNSNLASAKVSISNGFITGDMLAANTAGTSITASYNAAIGTLTLSGSDTKAHYQQVLDSVAFSSTSNDPTQAGASPTRTIDWQVSDGTANYGPLFQASTQYAAGHLARSVAIGDMNGDGRPDLAVANYDDNNVSVLLGTGNGTFGIATNFSVGANPRTVGVGDLNGDGRLDLVAASSISDTVSVLLGNGDGTFQTQTTSGTGSSPIELAIGDLNGDGRLDLVLANFGGSDVSVLLGNGNGTFGAATNLAAGTNPRSVAIADLNGDGRPDLVVANQNSDNVSVLLGNGDGTFSAATNFAAASGGGLPFSVAIGDINGDGKPDLAIAIFASDFVSVQFGNGDGTFQPGTPIGNGGQAGLFSVALGDLDGDGKLDLAVTNINSNTVSARLGNGDGTFAAPTFLATGTSPTIVRMADLNGDGALDLAVANLNDWNVSVLLNNSANLSAIQHTTINVSAGNHAPTALTDTNSGDPVVEAGVNPGNTPFSGDPSATGNVLGNDTDPDSGDTKTVQGVAAGSAASLLSTGVGTPIVGIYGTLTLAADGTYTYSLNNGDPDTNALAQGAFANDLFTYTMRDAAGETSTATLTIAVAGTNDVPIAFSDNPSMSENETKLADVLANDTAVDTGDTLSLISAAVASITAPAGVTLGNPTVGVSNNQILITPGTAFDALAAGQTAILDINYTLSDSFGATGTYHVQITVSGQNDAPTGVSFASTTTAFNEGIDTSAAVKVADIVIADADLGTNNLALTGADAGLFQIIGSALYLHTGVLNYETKTSYAVQVTVDDTTVGGTPDAASAVFTVAVNNLAPSTPTDNNISTNSVTEGALNGALVGITALATDPAGGAVTYSLSNNAGGRFAINSLTGVVSVANGALLDYEVATSHAITVQASDGVLVSSQDFTITVANVVGHIINGTNGADTIDATHTPPGQPLPTNEEDTIFGNNGADTIHGLGGNDNIQGGAGNDSIFGGDGNDTIFGGDGSDTLTGDAGNDRLDGGAAADQMYGGAGNDIYVVDSKFDLIDEINNGASGVDTVESSITFALSGNGFNVFGQVENLTLTGLSPIDGTGNALANSLTGNSGNNVLAGLGGADILDGNAGIDTATYVASGAAVNVSLTTGLGSGGDAQSDTLSNIENVTGSAFADWVQGNAGDNVLTGNGGSDALFGEAGNDTLNLTWTQNGNVAATQTANGGAGNDTINVTNGLNASLTVTIGGGAGNDTISLGVSGYYNVTGDDGEDYIYAGAYGNNNISGGNDNDHIFGAYGSNDTISGGSGNDVIYASVYGTNVIAGDDGDDTIYANDGGAYAAPYTISGGAGNDVIFNVGLGAYGAFTIDAGDGNDIVHILASGYYDSNNTSVTLGTGSDTLVTDSTTIGPRIYKITDFQTGAGGDQVNFTSWLNTTLLVGWNGSANPFAAGYMQLVQSGADTLLQIDRDALGSAHGYQTVIKFQNTNHLAFTSANFTTGHAPNVPVAGETLTGTNQDEAIHGTNAGDTISGLGGADTLNGYDGNDTLNGGAGADTLNGGEGNDIFIVDGSDAQNDVFNGGAGTNTILVLGGNDATLAGFNATTSSIQVWTGNGQGVVGTGADNVLNFGGLTLVSGLLYISGQGGNDTITGTYLADDLRGMGGNDVLFGGLGNDSMDGGSGQDQMSGGIGDDTYFVDSVSDQVIENANEGIDTVIAVVPYTLAANVENLTFTGGAALNGTGNSLDNVIIGNSGNNILSGLDGNDTLNGGAGTDTLNGGNGNDTFVVTGNEATNDIFNGGAGTDTIRVMALTSLTLANFNANVSSIEVWAGLGQEVMGTGGANVLDFSGLTSVTGLMQIQGLGGDDTITGTNFADTLIGGSGDDKLFGGSGDDLLAGGANDDVLNGGSGNDRFDVSGTEAQNDTFIGGSDTDTIHVLGATDLTLKAFDATSSSIEVWEGNGQGVVGTGQANTFDFSGITSITGGGVASIDGGGGDDTITGTNFHDVLLGSGGDDSLFGGGGNDNLDGGAGKDRLSGGAADDTLNGGNNDDTFVFAAGFGRDHITDFQAGPGVGDVIEINHSLFADFAAVMSHAAQVGPDVVITYDAFNTITLDNMLRTSLNANDFHII